MRKISLISLIDHFPHGYTSRKSPWWIGLKYCKLSKLCFITGKKFRLLRLYVVLKRIIFWFLVVFDCLKTSNGNFSAFSMLPSISDVRYFCSRNVFFFSSLKRFSFMFHFQKCYILSLEGRMVYLLTNVVGDLT